MIMIALVSAVFIYWIVLVRNKSVYGLTAFSEGKISWLSNIFLFVCSIIIVGALWSYVSESEQEGINKVPSPLEVILAFKALLISGKLVEESIASLIRIVVGFSMASLVGVFVGLAASSFILVNRFVIPINSFLRYIPPTAFISLLIVYFGIGETFKYAVIFFGVIFFIVQMVIDVVDDLDKKYLEMAITSGMDNLKIFRKVIIPSSLPRIVDVLRINLSAAWTFLVAAEIVGAEKGLGHLIATSQRYLRIDDLFVGILTFGIIGIITDQLIRMISNYYLRWYYISINR